MTNEQLVKEEAIVRAHPDYAQALELIEQIKRLKLEIGRKEFQLAALDIYGQQAGIDDQVARLDKLIKLEGV